MKRARDDEDYSRPSKETKYDPIRAMINDFENKQREMNEQYDRKISVVRELEKTNSKLVGNVEDDTVYQSLPFDVILQIFEFYSRSLMLDFYRALLMDKSERSVHFARVFYGYQLNDPNREISMLFRSIELDGTNFYGSIQLHTLRNRVGHMAAFIPPLDIIALDAKSINMDVERFTNLTRLHIEESDFDCSKFPQLQHLTIGEGDEDITEEFMSSLKALTNLRTLSVPTYELSGMSKVYKQLPNLTELTLFDSNLKEELTPAFSLENIRKIDAGEYTLHLEPGMVLRSSLTSLAIHKCKMLAPDTKDYSMTHSLTSLEINHLRRPEELLFFIQNNTTLKTLEIDYKCDVISKKVARELANCTNIEVLSLNSRMRPSLTKTLFDHTPILDFLRVLKLQQTHDMPILPTLLENTPSLTCLHIEGSECITEQVIAALENHPSITSLDLIRCKIPGDYAERLLLNTNLRALNLKFNYDTLFDGIDFAMCNQTLEFLKLNNNEKLPQSSIERIIRNNTSLKSLLFNGVRCSRTILEALRENQSLTEVSCSLEEVLEAGDLQMLLDSCPNLIRLKIQDQAYFGSDSDSDTDSG